MSKDYREALSCIWLYRDAESPKGTAATTGGVTKPFDSGCGFRLMRDTSDDSDEIAGREGASQLFRAALTAEGSLKQTRARPDFCLFTLAYFFGQISSEASGAAGYKHTISPLDDPDHPAFTAARRSGSSIMKERFVHNLVKGFTCSLGDAWVGMQADVVGSGKRDVNYTKEIVTAAENATQLTLASNAVEGDTAAARLENVRLVRVKEVGEQSWTVVTVTAVSDATPAMLSINAAGDTGTNVDYEIYYHPEEASWCDPPSTLDESPLRLVESKVVVDGYFDGSDIVGGISLGGDLVSCEVKGENEIDLVHVPDAGGDLFASESWRVSRTITLKLSRRFRDIVRQVQLDENEIISVLLRVQGALIPDGGGARYGFDLIFPRVGIVDAPVTVSEKILAEEGDLRVLVDETYGMGMVIGYNTVSSYL